MTKAVIDFDYLRERQVEIIAKELSIAPKDVIQTFHFQSPYEMQPHGYESNGLNWDDGYIPYNILQTVVDEAVSSFPHLYCFGLKKCNFIQNLLGRPVQNLDVKYPPSSHLKPRYTCNLSCHKFPKVSCATKNAYSFYKWLTYLFQTRSYVRCPKQMSQNTAMFFQEYKKACNQSPVYQST
jgi:hypothetical protein